MNILLAFLCAVFAMSPSGVSAVTVGPQSLPGSPLSCSPNPVRDHLILQFDNSTDQNLLWQIYDLTGRMIENGTYPAHARSEQIEAGAFHTGLYLICVSTRDGNDRKTTRFIKN